MNTPESTTGLFHELEKSTMKSGFENFLEHHPNFSSVLTFSDFMSEYISSHPDFPANVIVNRSGVHPDYAREILRGKKKGSKDKILALCLAAHMNLKDTRRALKIADFGDLYPKVPRDMALTICINNECFNLADVNEFLLKNNYEALDTCKNSK